MEMNSGHKISMLLIEWISGKYLWIMLSASIKIYSPKRIYTVLWCVLVGCHTIAQPVHFTEHSERLEYVMGTMGQAKCGVDMNGDGLDDITRVSDIGLYIDYQNEDGSFHHRFFPIDVQVLPVWSITSGDIDNNGLNDLVFGGGSHVSFVLAQNNGEEYVEFKMPDFIYSQRGTLSDIDLDGDLDAFICRDDGQSQAFRNLGSGNMVLDQSLINTSDLPGSYSAIWTDYNNDGYTDLYISKCLANAPPGDPARTNLLYHNNGNGFFSEKGAIAGLDDNAQSWSTVFEDFDNDEDFDAFIVNHDQENRLMRNNGDGTFSNVIEDSGIAGLDLGAFENASGDFNNDGFMDIFSELKNQLYLGNGNLTFTGQSLPFTPGAIGDFNNDGFLDVTFRNQLWINDGNDNHWIKINLRGIESNPNGIGARVEIYGEWGVQVRELRAGQSYSPMNSLTLHFGLGTSEKIDKLMVKWPGGIVTEINNLPADSMYEIPEASCILLPESITVTGNTELCSGGSVSLMAPPGYPSYIWSNGTSTSELVTDVPGRYHVFFIDSIGCMGLSQSVEITLADRYQPEITIVSGEAQNCEGVEVILKSSAGNLSYWSTGAQGTDQITVTTPGSYTVSQDSVCGDGQLISASIEITFLAAPAPEIESVMIVPGESVLLTSDGEQCAWYDAPVGGILLSDECSFQTLPIFSDTVVYAESHYQYPGAVQSGGKPDSLGFGGLIPSNKEIHFTAFKPFTLLSTDIYIPEQAIPGTRIIQLLTGNMILAEKSVFLFKGKNVVALDFKIPIGNFTLRCDRSDQFQNTGALDYPFPIGDVGQLDSSSTGLNFYPYFFNWKIQKEEITCFSKRAPISIDVITSFEDVFPANSFKIFPIPASNTLYLEIDDDTFQKAQLLILDVYGQIKIRKTLRQSNSMMLDINNLSPGMYQVILLADKTFATRLFVVSN